MLHPASARRIHISGHKSSAMRVSAARLQGQQRAAAALRHVAAAAARSAGDTTAALSRRSLLGSILLAGGISSSSFPQAQAEPLPLVPHVALTPDLSISQVIKGCWQLSGGHRGERSTDRTAGPAVVEDFATFSAAGITTWDAADHYGPAELLIGRYLKEHPEQRDSIQVATKYCVFSGRDMATLNKQAVTEAVNVSRQRLGVQKIDLLQLYWQDYGYDKYVDAALYLTDLQAAGVIGAVGVTNFDVPRLEAMLNKGAALVSNQVQYSLLDRRPANGMAEFCQAHNMSLLPYGVVAGGFLSERYVGLAAKDVDVNTYSKGKYAQILGLAGGWDWLQGLLKVLQQVATKHDTTISNVAARWVLQQPAVPAVILGARNALHVPDHQALFTFSLDADDQAAIDTQLARGRQAKGDCYSVERGGSW